MASITENHFTAGISHNIGATLNAVVERFAKYREFRATQNELQSLSGRELADLGINRANIKSVSYEAVYGA